MKKLLPLLLFACFLAPNLRAQGFEWAQVQDICPANTGGKVNPPHITSDGTNVISTGEISQSITFGSQTFTGGLQKNSFLAKHTSGGSLLWALQMQGVFGEPKVTTDWQGNIFVAGLYLDSLQIGNLHFTAGISSPKLFLAKFNPVGNLIWARQSVSGLSSHKIQVSTDGSGNVYVASPYAGSFSFGNSVATSSGQTDIFLARFETNGNLSWLQNLGGPGHENSPNILGGRQDGVAITFQSLAQNGFTNDVALQKYNGAGGKEWAKSIPNGSMGSPSLSMDAAGNLYLSGIMHGNIAFGNLTLAYNPGQNNNVCLAKISPNGHWKWAKAVQSGFPAEEARIATQLRNELYLYQTQNLFTNFNYEIYLSRLDTSGAITQTTTIGNLNRLKTTGMMDLTALAADNTGNLFLSGIAGGKITLSPVVLNAPPAIPSTALSFHSSGFIAKLMGNPNTITGKVFIDDNGNGLREPGEAPYENAILEILPDQNYTYQTTDSAGDYRILLPDGTYNLKVHQPAQHYTFLPQIPTVTLTGPGQTRNRDIALVPIPNRTDVKVSVTNVTPARPARMIRYRLTYQNVGTTTQTDSLSLQFQAQFLTFTGASTTPVTQQTGKLSWVYQSLKPNEKRNIDVFFKVDTFIIQNTVLNAFAAIGPRATDFFPQNNTDTLRLLAINSWDPNDKQVNLATINPNQIAGGRLLDYTIRFQNTGNDTAFTVIVRDSIGNGLQIPSIELLSASHPYTFRLRENGIAEWRFDNILLPDSNRNEAASHGFIRYRIKPSGNLATGYEVRSRAGIVFDFNAPVMTNHAVTKVVENRQKEPTGIANFLLYPNPAGDYVKIEAELGTSEATTVTLVNMLGQTITEVTFAAEGRLEYQLPLKSLAKGVYVVRLATGSGTVSKRLLIR